MAKKGSTYRGGFSGRTLGKMIQSSGGPSAKAQSAGPQKKGKK